ncbi:helix-turn-helix transcriptional regulator [Rhizobium sp. S163]|uniref:helix-turn-helix transcriptional regulator n=1 Tax=Rhizobium sp. S163 TaxID=3055039 RepID=UPI0025A9A30B|nr:helix-turn-helix transcriptional regulator [Rhizobium sp. S163]MDM9648255.1 helix-turn-helix transcriptional regulator [Rhizobium sp. S163]
MRAEATSHLTDLIYGSLFGECDWQAFLDAVARTSPDGKAALHYHDLTSPVAHVPFISGFSEAEVADFSMHYAAVNPWIPRMNMVPVGQGLCGDEIFARRDLVRSEFYNDWLKRQARCETSVGVSIIREETRSFILSTATSCADPEENRAAAERYTLLSPHLKRAFDFIRRRDLVAPKAQGARGLFDSIGAGLLYICERRRLRWSNEAADLMLASGYPIRTGSDGKILIRSDAAAAALQALLVRGGGYALPQTFFMRNDVDQQSFRLTVVRLQSSRFTEFLEGPTVAVIVEPALATIKDRQRSLLEDAKLTAAEVKVALSIASGNTPRQTATAFQIGYETVRTHLRNVYSKLGVNSQVALATLLLGT